MFVINKDSIGEAHEEVIKYILMHGRDVKVNNTTTFEVEPVSMVVRNPMSEPRISNLLSFSKSFMEKYTTDIISGRHQSKSKFVYDYHDRIWHYPSIDASGVDQIDYIIKKLKQDPTSRRAIAITLDPEIDESLEDIPCLQLLLFTIRDNRLDLKVVFRSNDMLLAAGANMYALTKLQSQVLSLLETEDLKLGTYTHISLIPHLYVARDTDIIKRYFLEYVPYSKVKYFV
jgi:thymidylate synthase